VAHNTLLSEARLSYISLRNIITAVCIV